MCTCLIETSCCLLCDVRRSARVCANLLSTSKWWPYRQAWQVSSRVCSLLVYWPVAWILKFNAVWCFTDLTYCRHFIGPILWGHSGPLCHALSLALSLWKLILHCHSPGVATVACRLRYRYSWLRLILLVVSTVATPGEWQCKIRTDGVRRLAVANGPNIFQMLLVKLLPVQFSIQCGSVVLECVYVCYTSMCLHNGFWTEWPLR